MNYFPVPADAAEPTGRCTRAASDQNLNALAARNANVQSQQHARLVLRKHGFSGNPAAVEALMTQLENIRRIRNRRATARERSSHAPTLHDRLTQARQRAVMQAAKECLRFGAAGGGSMTVTLTRDPTAVTYQVQMDRNWNTYRGHFKGWAAMEDHHHVCVPTDWRTRVLRRGLATAGGMLTLDLQQLVSHGDIELYQAVWVAQSRGYGVSVHRGIIARLGAEVVHADSTAKAIRSIALKATYAAKPRRPRGAYDIDIEAFIKRYSRYSDVLVDVDDARATGACEYGIRSWCEAVGIDIDEQVVPIHTVLEAFRKRPLIEVRRTVLHAIRGHRSG